MREGREQKRWKTILIFLFFSLSLSLSDLSEIGTNNPDSPREDDGRRSKLLLKLHGVLIARDLDLWKHQVHALSKNNAGMSQLKWIVWAQFLFHQIS
jgi:hypothetical protein